MAIPPGSVWLDARGAQSAQHAERGIARYVAEHIRALVKLAPGAIGSIGLDSRTPPPPSLESLVGSGLFARHRRTRGPDRPVPEIYHVMSPFEASLEFDDIWPVWMREGGSRLVVTLHDLIPLIMYDEYIREWGANGLLWMARLGLIRAAHQIVANSEHTARDAVEHLGIPEERITVIHSGVSSQHSSLVATKEEAERIIRETLPKVRPGFLLYVGGDDHRKNLDGAMRAYARLPEAMRDAHQLVIAFRVGPLRKFELRVAAQPLGIRPRDLIFTGFVTDEQLAALYRSCELFVFPSLYEGAGLPILEAMSCGAPVAASNTSSIPELLGDLEATFDPADPTDIARGVREALETPGERDRLRERSRRRVELYTWGRVAELTLPAYEKVLEGPLPRAPGWRPRTRVRKRLAFVTPWPPMESPEALHSRRLAEELAEHAELEVIVPAAKNGRPYDQSLEGKVVLRTDAEFRWMRELRRYDACLFAVGNSRSHMHALEAMLWAPGVVLCHDVQLLDLYREMGRIRNFWNPFWAEIKLAHQYGDRHSVDELKLVPYDDRGGERFSMTGEVQTHAQRVLVHSRHQAELLRLDRPPAAAPTEVVPFAIPDFAPARNGRAGDGPLIVDASAEPRPAALRAAFARVAEAHPGARLETLAALGGRAGRADLAIRLQADPEGGRASGEVAELIARGVPTVVSELGWQGELPESVVMKVAADSDAAALAERMGEALADEKRREVRSAQERFAAENSFSRVAERYAELLSL
jgi:glycosyltransferase involved in cell wall biosynthesis